MSKTQKALFQGDSLIRAKDAAVRCGMGTSSWWRLVSLGIAPQPIRIGQRFTAWRASQIAQFIEDMAAGRVTFPPIEKGERHAK